MVVVTTSGEDKRKERSYDYLGYRIGIFSRDRLYRRWSECTDTLELYTELNFVRDSYFV